MSELIDSLTQAVRSAPDAVPLRLHLAELLLADGQRDRAFAELGQVLAQDPQNARALELLGVGVASPGAPDAAGAADQADPVPAGPASADPAQTAPAEADPATTEPATATDPAAAAAPAPPAAGTDGIDWTRLEEEVGVEIAPPFVGRSGDADDPKEHIRIPTAGEGEVQENEEAPPEPDVTLADIGGLDHVKDRLRVAFLEPMRNPEIAKVFSKGLRGGLLLYGPPGTGKTFIARAVAGELGARFFTATMADILNSFIGDSEKAVRAIFGYARRHAPCVLFLDELDAIGGRRSGFGAHASWMRSVVNQLLVEMDGVGSDNDGVFILAAMNHPWDVDEALMRPGRFDRVVLVPAPDAPARAAILQLSLEGRPIAGIDLDDLVRRTEGYSGADLTHLVSTAAEKAMTESIASGEIRPVDMNDLHAALEEVKPSIGPWMQAARNVVNFSNEDGRWDDLRTYLEAEKKRKK